MRPSRRSSLGSPTCASARSAALTCAIVASPPNTSSTRSRIELSYDRSRVLACSSLTFTTRESTSASSSLLSPAAMSSLGRSTGNNQTSGSMPDRCATEMRSAAAAPSDRSMTVTSPPALSLAVPIMVLSADQPESVPPATSTRSISTGSDTAYHSSCRSYSARRACHSWNCRACSACHANSRFSCSARILPSRWRSSPILD